ncbi:hypothetical protein PRVXT_000549 [Proteinivorax tanatarense]|uniref:YvlB/LiaX N-terminal domain-containing protein n=1 Tax=Proteinivorax tanatarense TaxID=1260629 RepID=A0AAU7VNA9_9FIRM
MNEKMQVLKMIESGKVTAEEGMKLLAAVESKGDNSTSKSSARQLRIKVINKDSGRVKTNIKIPMYLVSIGMKFIPQDSSLTRKELAEAIQLAKDKGEGTVLEVEDKDSNYDVHIMVE